MTKKDFAAIAQIIKHSYVQGRSGQHVIEDQGAKICKFKIANKLCDYFYSRNPRFDAIKFLEACDVPIGGSNG